MNIIRDPFPFPFPGIDVGKIIKRIAAAGKAFFKILRNGDDVKDKEAYNEKKSSADDVLQLNSALTEYRKKVQTECSEMEEQIQKICKEVFESILDSLEFANSQFQFYRIETAQRKLDRYLSEIEGIFAKHVAKRISLDDAECVAVLKMPPGEVKGERMADLKKKVFEETIADLCKHIEEFESDFFDGMDLSVEARLDGIEESIKEKQEKFRELSEVSENAGQKAEDIKLNAYYSRDLAQLFDE